MSKMYEIFGNDAYSMTRKLMEAAEVIKKIPSGANVALKPNLVVSKSPDSGATTHAGVLAGVISYLQDHGIRDISVIEGSWVGDSTGRAFRAAGYEEVGRKYGVPLYDLKQDQTRTVQTPLRPMEICGRALDAGYLINLPVLKGHCQTAMTCALKNCKGCLPDREKRRFHAEGLMKPIAALASALRPPLTIVDSICGDLDFEEGGNPVYTGRMILGEDPVQLDAYGCRLMGLPLSEVPYIELAEQWGAGSAQVCGEDILRLNEPSQGGRYPKPSAKVARLTAGVCQDSACSACYASLVRALYSCGGSHGTPIAIGQGWKGREFQGLGIGRCCDGASRQVKGCPPTADAIAAALTGKE
ncbi:DUF362 domain-containing protein [Caproiciproducens sp. NJN-50]|uniref:DUF362 domain-containing protein n=1 Tax=Caproiciproducens sp. NJN-50 TaxID=2507162 RepID=UPI000FFE1D61|nr:DUF362 domain-containing protein [Caproiciproducens sp. NJN-50]QAT48669.1 DUF362 domain-containing protein [Caproiciproducens sp. NJN-50]